MQYFMQDNPMIYTVNFALTALEKLFGEWLIHHRSWPPRSLDVNLCSYYLWRISKDGY